jgi:hypothetical protein
MVCKIFKTGSKNDFLYDEKHPVYQLLIATTKCDLIFTVEKVFDFESS